MTNSKDLTMTEGRAKKAVDNIVTEVAMPKVNDKVEKAVKDDRTRTGVITKFYPYIDRAEVKLDNTNEKILCKMLHRYGGELIDFFTPLAERVEYDKNLGEKYIVPRVRQNVLVIKIHEDDSDENLVLGNFIKDEIIEINPASPGNMKLAAIANTNDYYIKFGVDGLSYKLPKKSSTEVGYFEDEMQPVEYYTKEEVDSKIKNNDDSDNISYEDLLEFTQLYKQTSDDTYYLFRGDCWTVNNNFESSAAITSDTYNDFTVTGTFRTKNDLVGLYWNSKDPIEHPYISYGERSDYRNVVLDFDYTMSGCKNFNNSAVSITIRTNISEVFYLTMNRFISNGHVHLDFNNLTLLPGNQYIDADGNAVQVETETPVDVSNIQSIMFVIIPNVDNFNTLSPYTITENVDFTCKISNIQVKRGDICKEHVPLEPHPYRLCEGYDDFYNLNPKRVCREMRKLGYAEWCDLYIGASHYYEKSGTVGDTITIEDDFNHNRTEKMVLDSETPLNKAFTAWLNCYAKELKANDCDKLVLSVSMENLQCPTSWRQRDVNGNYAVTGWVPSTFFYSPCNDEPVNYMKSVSKAVLDIAVENGLQPILQMGEAWWWWNENDRPSQPPCFYDNATKTKYQSVFGKPLPEYQSSWSNFNDETIYWLNQELASYVDALRTVVKSSDYTNGLYLALFFPPSVMDKDRVPKMMRNVNFIETAYHPSKLDIIQIEDYDWVTGITPETKERDRSHHPEVYKIGQKLGFPENKIHYFGGFVQYPKDAIEYWKLIQEAIDEALHRNFAEVYVWAGSQIRRDKKIIGYLNYELVQQLLFNQQ